MQLSWANLKLRWQSNAMPMKPFEILHTNIYMLCRLCGWSIADLAKKSGIGITSLYRWMNGETKNPNPAHTTAVAGAFAKKLGVEITVADLWNCELSEQKVLLRREGQ
jgi:transcriptional regulator with XRE-family HTH domain